MSLPSRNKKHFAAKITKHLKNCRLTASKILIYNFCKIFTNNNQKKLLKYLARKAMDLTRHVRRRTLNGGTEDLSELYPHDLQLYDKIPSTNILLHDFEEMALERLKALKVLDTVNSRGFSKFSEEWKLNFNQELIKQNLKHLANYYSSPGTEGLKKDFDLRRKDHISHFILCMAFCRNEELKHWFMNREIELFQYRFDHLSSSGILVFLNLNNFDYKPIPEIEKKKKMDLLSAVNQFQKPGALEKTPFYKIPFRKVIELVRSRRVLLENGICYVASTDLGSVLATKLRQDMSHHLAVLRQNLPETTEDQRLDSILKFLLEHYEAGNYRPPTDNSTTIRIEDLNELSKKSFPPCMRRLHETLITKHHLRHQGRQQYQLFLKGAGLSLEDSLKFWRSEFVKVMEPAKFEREHAYNIRHNYGKEGNRVNYTAYGCKKIIGSQPGPEDCHGCPFRHCRSQDLKRLLRTYKITEDGVNSIMEYVDGQMYTLACQKLFVITHEKEHAVEFGLSHPNQYFAESRQLIIGKTPFIKTEGIKIEGSPAVPTNKPSPNVTTPNPTGQIKTPVVNSTPPSRRSLVTKGGHNKPTTANQIEETNKNVMDWLDDEDLIAAMETD